MLIWIKHIVLSTTNMVSIFLLYDYHPFVVSLFWYFSQFLTRLNPKMHDEMNLVVLVISIIWDFWLFPNIFQKILLKYFIKTLKHIIYGPYHMDHMIWYLGRIPRNFKTFILKSFLSENHKKMIIRVHSQIFTNSSHIWYSRYSRKWPFPKTANREWPFQFSWKFWKLYIGWIRKKPSCHFYDFLSKMTI